MPDWGMHNPANRMPGREARMRKGPISQRDLVRLMKPLVDACMAKGASRGRDDARATLRRLLAETNWQTSWVLSRMGTKRCRYINSLGYPIEGKFLWRDPAGFAKLHEQGR